MTLQADRLGYLHGLQARVYGSDFEALPHQTPPDGDWFFWLLEAGRGAGKTAAAAHYMKDHLNGPACFPDTAMPHRASLVAPTIGDGIESANLNDQALTRIQPGANLTTKGGGSMVEWPNGSQVRIFGAHTKEDVNRLRAGGNRCLVWAEEVAAWRYLEDAWGNMMYGLRIGEHVRIVGTTTPKPREQYVTVRNQADHVAHATTLDNPNLNERQKERLLDLYGDTSFGRQELFGELIEEAEGALWTYELINQGRRDEVEGIGRVAVGLDPPGGATEAGIVAAGVIPSCRCGIPRQPHYAVMADRSGKLSPEAWATRAVDLLAEVGGDRIVAEKNYGGEMVVATIAQVDAAAPVKPVSASRGKRIRAEPVQALYQQQRVHHLGHFPELEAEMVQWIPDESDWSPNRIDALVWAVSDLTKTKGRRKMTTWRVDQDLSKPAGL